jgi:hypothetical protein
MRKMVWFNLFMRIKPKAGESGAGKKGIHYLK